jgi:carboxylesterase type B
MYLLIKYAATEAYTKRCAGIPVWRGRYFAVWSNLTPFPNDSSVGAYHGSDVYLFLGTVADVHLGNSTAEPTQAELMLSSRYMDAWLTFAEVSFICVPLILGLLIN